MNDDNWPYLLLVLVLLAVLCPWWVAALYCCCWGGAALSMGGLLLCCWLRLQPPATDPLADQAPVRADVVAVVCEPAVATSRGCRFVVEVHNFEQHCTKHYPKDAILD